MDCYRCGGIPMLSHPSWAPFNSGRCFRCNGSGVDPIRKETGMCGKLKFEGNVSLIGEKVRVAIPYRNTEANVTWAGFATQEKQDWWSLKGDARVVEVQASSFVEGKFEISVSKRRIQALGLKKDVWVSGKLIGKAGEIKILTRPAETDFERSVHSRWPLVLDEDGQVCLFSSEDCVSSHQSELSF